jgi:hypothetical protein
LNEAGNDSISLLLIVNAVLQVPAVSPGIYLECAGARRPPVPVFFGNW